MAIVGPSGSGKSTLLALMERFYDVGNGEVCVDGKNLRDVNLRSWREQLGYVAQVLASWPISNDYYFIRWLLEWADKICVHEKYVNK